MKKITLILMIVLFVVGTLISSTPTQAVAPKDPECVRRCNEGAREARRRCRDLGGNRDECLRAVRERHQACLARCRNN